MDYTLGGIHEEAAKAFERAVRLSPADWEAHYLSGRALYELKNLPAARAALERAAQLDPASVRARAALGQVEERLQDLPAAECSYRGAVELCGNRGAECAWPLLELGLLTKRLSGDDKAEPYLRKAIAARPDWAKPHFFLGKLLATRDDLEAARTELETAVKLDAAKSEYYYQLALVCRRMGRERDAERYLARFREIAKLGESADHDIELTQP
jgi:Flp pilus assembly protein TadD